MFFRRVDCHSFRGPSHPIDPARTPDDGRPGDGPHDDADAQERDRSSRNGGTCSRHSRRRKR